MTLNVPQNIRRPLLELGLPATTEQLDILVRNATTGKRLALAIPAGWAGADLVLDFFRQTIKDQNGVDRSALLDPLETDLWLLNPLLSGINDLEIEVFKAFSEISNTFVTAPSEPSGVAVDGTYIYWGDGTNIGRSKLNGSEPNAAFIAAPENALGVAVNATHIFWADTTAGTIGRAKLDGTEANNSFVTTPVAPTAVAVNATHIFWADTTAGTIGRATLAGGSPNNNFITLPVSPRGVYLDGTYVYWTDVDISILADTIGRAKLDGTEANNSFVDVPYGFVNGIAVTSRRIYWSVAEQIGRVNLDGTLLRAGLLTAPEGAADLAADSTYIYWAEQEKGAIGRARLNEKVAIAVTAKLSWDRGYY